MTLRVLGVIPARAGSKGVPGKNLRPLAGRTLVERARDAARASGILDRLIVSTDSPEIVELAHRLEIEVPFLRPPELATDDAPMLGVVTHALRALEAEGYRPDAVALLQPTSPARTPQHLRDALELLESTPAATSVVSVAPIPPQFAPQWAFTIERGMLRRALADGPLATRRQDIPPSYYRDGTIYLTRRDTLMETNDIYGDACLPLVLPPDETLTIDTPDDWAKAERLFAGGDR